MKRRDMLCAAGAAPIAALLAAKSSDAAEDLLPIIDTHQHLWDLKKFQPPWLAGAPKVLGSSHVTSDFLEATKGLNVVKAIYMEIDVHPDDQVREAKHVIELCKDPKHPTSAAIISGRPNSEGFAKYLRPLLKSGYVKGVRQVLHVPSAEKGMCLQKQFVRSMKFLGKKQINYDFCMRPTELADGAKLAKLCPETQFVVDHCGNADPKAFMAKDKQPEEPWHTVDQWKRGMEALAKQDNVACKISGIIARAPKGFDLDGLAPIVNFCLDSFGPDRVVFGGDWPVCKLGGSYRQWVTALRRIIANRPESERRKLLHDNAVRIYRLS